MKIFYIPTLTRCVSIGIDSTDYDAEGQFRTIDGEGFLVCGDPLRKKHDAYLREYGTQEIKSGVMLVCDSDVESALRMFFTHKGTKTGLAGKGSSQALQINPVLPIVELPACASLGKSISRMAQTLHDGLCSMHRTTAADCPAQRALDVISEMSRGDWNTFVSEDVSIGGRGGQGFAFISAETLMEHPLFAERMQQQARQYASA